jgi:hypothetical protein
LNDCVVASSRSSLQCVAVKISSWSVGVGARFEQLLNDHAVASSRSGLPRVAAKIVSWSIDVGNRFE